MKQRGEKISMLTAYDYTAARILDEAGVDAILVGDSAANVMAGYTTTVPMTADEMIVYAASVVRGTSHTLVICDMPLGAYTSPDNSIENAVRIMQRTGCDALKLKGGAEIINTVRHIINMGIPVMGHPNAPVHPQTGRLRSPRQGHLQLPCRTRIILTTSRSGSGSRPACSRRLS